MNPSQTKSVSRHLIYHKLHLKKPLMLDMIAYKNQMIKKFKLQQQWEGISQPVEFFKIKISYLTIRIMKYL